MFDALLTFVVCAVVSGAVTWVVVTTICDWGWRRDLRARRRVRNAEWREQQRWWVPSEPGWIPVEDLPPSEQVRA